VKRREFHHAARGRGRMAARGARAAAGDAHDRLSLQPIARGVARPDALLVSSGPFFNALNWRISR
jgi:hypothetical protein